MKVSIIIPVYNEESVIGNCLGSLLGQTAASDFEIIVVDDGSTDKTAEIVNSFEKVKLLKQNHKGPGAARNLGAEKAKGDILVFVDADMEFEPDFIEKLIKPVQDKKAIGTYSSEEFLLNKSDPWAVCWNLNFSGHKNKLSSQNKQSYIQKTYLLFKRFLESAETKISPISHQKVTSLGEGKSNLPYRAILKTEFLRVGGFSTNVGYTDDWTLAEKLGQLPEPVAARYYHRNPSTLPEIWKQARWIGRDQLKTGNLIRQIHSLIVYNPLTGLVIGVIGTIKFKMPKFFIFKIVFDTGIFVSVMASFFSEQRAR